MSIDPTIPAEPLPLYEVMYDWIPENDTDLKLEVGDVIEVRCIDKISPLIYPVYLHSCEIVRFALETSRGNT
jgi:hypothetical protein